MSEVSADSNKNLARGRSTRLRLIELAIELFAERGFENTPVELILDRAGVSKGSLYHHFANKEALFEAVLDVVEAQVADATVKAASEAKEPLEAVRAGSVAWLHMAAEDPVVRQIVLLDAPAVMGWEKWREIDDRHAFGILKHAIAALPGRAPEVPSETLAHVLLASIIELAMLIARAGSPRKALPGAEAALDRLLAGMFGTAQ